MSDKPQKAPYPLRMPDGMREKLKDAAHKNQRSLNAEIVARLQESLDPLNEFVRDFGDGQPTGLENLFAELEADNQLANNAEDQHILDLLRTRREMLQSMEQVITSIDARIKKHRRQLKSPE